MRFFTTGNLHSSKGPRSILGMTLVMLLLFVFAHSIREGLHLGIGLDLEMSLSHISEALHGIPSLGSRSLITVIEDLHIDLFLLSLTILFLGAIFFHLPFLSKNKMIFFSIFMISTLSYPLSKLMVYWNMNLAIVAYISFLIFHLALLVWILLLLIFLYMPTVIPQYDPNGKNK